MEYQTIEVNGENIDFPIDMSDADIAKAISGNIISKNDATVPSAIEKPIDFAEINNRPEPYTLSPQNVALAGLISTVGGGLYAKLAKTGGSLAMGALEGGFSGVGSSAVGELIKEATNNSNIGQLTALGGEMLTGAALPLTRDLITRVPTAALMAGLGYAKAKTAQAILGESESSRVAKNVIFGKDLIKPGVATTKYQEAFDSTSALDMANRLNISVPTGVKAQDVIRQTMYDTMSLQTASGNPIKNTPVYSDLMAKLKQVYKDGGDVKKEDIPEIARLLNGQNSTDPNTFKTFNQRLLNTAQQATKEYNGVKLGDESARLLKEAIDSYTGKPYYKLLKEQETKRFTAKAMDDIPVLLDKGISGDTLETSLRNLSENPYGKANFKIALSSYLRGLPEKEALSEWNRLYSSNVLTKSKVMDLGDLYSLNRKVKLYTEKGYIKKAGDITGHALKMSLITGILPTEATSRLNPNDSLKAFSY